MRDKKEAIQELEYTFEYIAERLDGLGTSSYIDVLEVPSLKYLISLITEETGASEAKVVEAFERWQSGIRRKYG